MASHPAPANLSPPPYASDDPYLSGQYAPVFDELTVEELRVTGELPDGLRGAFLRNGPNQAFPPPGRYHIFDGDGMVHGVWFDGEGKAGTARYANRWVRSRGLLAELDEGRALYGGLSEFTLPGPELVAKAGMMKNTANTHVVGHAGRILALMEGARPTELGPDLETIGELDFGGALQGAMTAHPKVDPETGAMVFFGYSPFPPYVRLYEADATGTITWATEVELPGPVMMHDFVVTRSRVVLFDLPAVFDIEAMLAGRPGIHWAPERGARVGVVDRGAPGDTARWIEVDPFWVFHFLNAHDAGPDLVEVTGCRAPRLNATFGDQTLDEPAHPSLHRWRIDLAAGTVATEQLDDRPGDFPRLDDRRAGLAFRYGYLGEAGEWTSDRVDFGAVRKHDLAKGSSQVASYGTRTNSGEPVFAADPDDPTEDAGWVLNFCHDWDADESTVRILDAATLEEAARVHLPRRVPFGFHGSFLPAG
jgi:carotenoid cleavage dioxygenase